MGRHMYLGFLFVNFHVLKFCHAIDKGWDC